MTNERARQSPGDQARGTGGHPDANVTIGNVAIAAAVTTVPGRSQTNHPILLHQLLDTMQIVQQFVPLVVDDGIDVMRNLCRPVADAHATVKGRGPEPERTAIVRGFLRLPEAHMMALLGTVARALVE